MLYVFTQTIYASVAAFSPKMH